MLQKSTILIIILLCGIYFKIIAQVKSFEGKIEYSTSIKAKSNANTNALKNMYGTGLTIFLKNGYFKQVYQKAGAIEWCLYDYKTNRLYNKLPNRDTLYYFDCSKEKRKVMVAKSNLKDNILGYACQSVTVQSPIYKFTSFYAPQIPLNPKWFSQYKLEGYNQVVQYSKSVWLKLISENPACIITNQALKINRQTISDDIFRIPALPTKEIKQQ